MSVRECGPPARSSQEQVTFWLGTRPSEVGWLKVQLRLKTVLPPCMTVMVALVKAMSVMFSLHELFGQSGAPGTGDVGARVVTMKVTLPPARRRPQRAAVLAGLALAGLAVGGAWAWRARVAREAGMRASLARLESARERLSVRLERLKRQLGAERATEDVEAPAAAAGPSAGETIDVPAAPPATTPPVRYADDSVSLSVTDMSVREVLDEIARQSGAVIRGQVSADRKLRVAFENVTLREALDRVLGERNFVLVYDQRQRPRVVELLDGASPTSETTVSTAPRETPSERTERSLRAVLGLLDGHPNAALEGKLAAALETDAMSLRQLLDTGLRHPYRTIRERAMRRFVGALEGDPDLGSALVGTLAEIDDASLGDVVRRIAGERAEEMLFYVATQASGELRSRAAALLEGMHAAG